jgi:CDGSH-type Zn-finger protein
MARIVIHTKKAPYLYKTPKGDVVAICMCGLSDTYPLCSGKHTITTDEEDDIVYFYDPNKKRVGRATKVTLEDGEKDVQETVKV